MYFHCRIYINQGNKYEFNYRRINTRKPKCTNETFDSVTIAVQTTSNFTNDSETFTDSINGIVIQIANETIPEKQLQNYVESFEKEMNATQVNINWIE